MAKAPSRYVPKSRRTSRIKKPRILRDLNSSTNLSVSGKAFPVSLMTDLKWGFVTVDTIASTLSKDHRIRANSIYDPDFSTGFG